MQSERIGTAFAVICHLSAPPSVVIIIERVLDYIIILKEKGNYMRWKRITRLERFLGFLGMTHMYYSLAIISKVNVIV